MLIVNNGLKLSIIFREICPYIYVCSKTSSANYNKIKKISISQKKLRHLEVKKKV